MVLVVMVMFLLMKEAPPQTSAASPAPAVQFRGYAERGVWHDNTIEEFLSL